MNPQAKHLFWTVIFISVGTVYTDPSFSQDAGKSSSAGVRSVSTPNVILILSDDAGWADFGFQGSSEIPTPHLDGLAARGVRFGNAYAGSVCSPSRACLVTGLYNSRIGYEMNIPENDFIIGTSPVIGLDPNQITIFDRMRDLGYVTGVVGKWHLGLHADNVQNGILFHPGNQPVHQGVDEFCGFLSGSRPYWGGEGKGTGLLRQQSLNKNGTINDQIVEGKFQGKYVTDILGDWSTDFIRRHSEARTPFFLFSSFTAPHRPMQATPSDLAAVDRLGRNLDGQRRTYAAMMLALDRQVGKILTAVSDPNGDGDKSDSKENETLIIFANDNGGDCWDKDPNGADNGALKAGKGSNWEGGIRVPMIFAGAGVKNNRSNSTFDHPVHLVDILPTITALGGATKVVKEKLDGVDLLPFVNGDLSGPPHQHLYLRYGPGQQVAVRMGDWKLFHSQSLGFMLFDLNQNPGEKVEQNLADQHPDVVKKMKQIMTDYDVQMRRPLWGVPNFSTEFRFRESWGNSEKWSAPENWSVEKGLTGILSISSWDGYADTGLVFRAKQTGKYISHNDLTRQSGLPFLANYLKVRSREGKIEGDTTGTIQGNPIMLVHSLAGEPARIQLDSVSTASSKVEFDFALEIQLYSDLTFRGDGKDLYRFSGGITEFRPGINVTKLGESVVTLSGPSRLSGTIEILSGSVRVEHPAALGTAKVIVRKGASLVSTMKLDEATLSQINGEGAIEIAR